MSQIRNKARLDRMVEWFRREMPPKPYMLEKPPKSRDFPFPWFFNTFFKTFGRFLERQGVHFYNNTEIGLYHKDWNPRVHGVYCHWRYYGTNRDIPLTEVKLNDLRAWLSRRDYSPRALVAEFRRLFFQYKNDYLSGSYHQNPVEHIFRVLFTWLFLMWLIRGIIMGYFDHTKEAIYHW
ncbi:hypothetical protein Mgra_00002673 [Meloidogyne graminicola]|uniref:Uncharacterized protein n=1 Tax=Meloidogyne graminicola TaxID=189291 RepID=A0A8S9ZXX0_9BILA|nr:hypothetical protein Mgra_00002673 [Meloidogyne graminicola]